MLAEKEFHSFAVFVLFLFLLQEFYYLFVYPFFFLFIVRSTFFFLSAFFLLFYSLPPFLLVIFKLIFIRQLYQIIHLPLRAICG